MTKVLKVLILFTLLFFICSDTGFSQTLPHAPEGFSWKKLDQVKAAVLIPAGWYFKQEKAEGTWAFFLTKENLEKSKWYKTGISIQVFQQKPEGTAENLAFHIIAGYAKDGGLIKTWNFAQGVYKGYGWQGVAKKEKGELTKTHGLVFLNTGTKTVYLVLFESPEPEWEENWRTGEKLTQMIGFSDDI